MELILPLIFVTIQLFLVIFVVVQLIRGMFPYAAEKKTLNQSIHIIAFLLTILMLFSFISYEASSFNNEPYFPIFIILVVLGILAYWISKSNIALGLQLQNLTQTFTGILCWMSFFTAIKFYPYYPYAWFPLLGFLALGPIFFTLMSLQEMIRKYHQKKQVHPILSLGFSLGVLIVIQLILNSLTTESWVLIKIFNPENTFV